MKSSHLLVVLPLALASLGSQCGAKLPERELPAEGEGEGEGPAEGEGEGPPPDGACTGDADMEILENTDVQGAATGCAFQCMQDPDMEACTRACIIEQTGLTEPCAQCFAALIACIGANCLMVCLDPNNPECGPCTDQHCSAAFLECSGLPAAAPPPPQ